MQDRTTETRQDTTECITRHDRIIQIHVGKKKKNIDERSNKTEKMKFGKRKKRRREKVKGKNKYINCIYIYLYVMCTHYNMSSPYKH